MKLAPRINLIELNTMFHQIVMERKPEWQLNKQNSRQILNQTNLNFKTHWKTLLYYL